MSIDGADVKQYMIEILKSLQIQKFHNLVYLKYINFFQIDSCALTRGCSIICYYDNVFQEGRATFAKMNSVRCK
jgi:hypothetical protein